jgi:hypothetical protein
VPQAPVEAVGFRAERPALVTPANATGVEQCDAEPLSRRPGNRPGDDPKSAR